MALHLHYLLDLGNAKLKMANHIHTFVAALLGDSHVFIVHRFEKIFDQHLKLIRVHLAQPFSQCRDLNVVVLLDFGKHLLVRAGGSGIR